MMARSNGQAPGLRELEIDVRSIVAIALNLDAEVRNHQIVLAYHEMSRLLDPILHRSLAPRSENTARVSNANWFTVATWAVSTIGRHIRNREVPRRIDQLMPNSLRSRAEPWVLTMRSSAGQRVARALGQGQLIVFASTMFQGLRFVERHLSAELAAVAGHVDRLEELAPTKSGHARLVMRLASSLRAARRQHVVDGGWLDDAIDHSKRIAAAESGAGPYDPDEATALVNRIEADLEAEVRGQPASDIADAVHVLFESLDAARSEDDERTRVDRLLDAYEDLHRLIWLRPGWAGWAAPGARELLDVAQRLNAHAHAGGGDDDLPDLRHVVKQLRSSIEGPADDGLTLLALWIEQLHALHRPRRGAKKRRRALVGELRALSSTMARLAQIAPGWAQPSGATRRRIDDAIADVPVDGGSAADTWEARLDRLLVELGIVASRARQNVRKLTFAQPFDARDRFERITELDDQEMNGALASVGIQVEPERMIEVRTLLTRAFVDVGHADLEAAIAAYERASWSSNPRDVAQEIFRGNLIITAVEQALLDHPVTTVVDHVPDEFQNWIEGTSARWLDRSLRVPRRIGRLAVAGRTERANVLVKQAWARLLTNQVLVVSMPTETIRVGVDIPEPREHSPWFYPDQLAELSDATPTIRVADSRADLHSTRALFEMYDRSRGSGRGTGARDWRRFDERLNFAGNLIRSRQQTPSLFWEPYNKEDRARIAQGRRPASAGDPFEGQVLAPAPAVPEAVR